MVIENIDPGKGLKLQSYSWQRVKARQPVAGEPGVLGGVITPQYGPRQRFCCITVDAELPLDEPVDLGVAAFSDECLTCVAKCPAKAIPEKPLWWRGVCKREVNDIKCFRFLSEFKGCAIRINSCPFYRFGFREVMEHYGETGEVLGKAELLAEKVRLRRKGERWPGPAGMSEVEQTVSSCENELQFECN